jgi:hypothetical protein
MRPMLDSPPSSFVDPLGHGGITSSPCSCNTKKIIREVSEILQKRFELKCFFNNSFLSIESIFT